MTSDIGPSSPIDIPASSHTHPYVRLGVRVLVATAAAGVVLGSAALPASAANPSSNAETEADVQVLSGITITDLTDSFTLTGAPGVVASNQDAVDVTVLTNDAAGYTVTVQGEVGGLQADPSPANNTDTIPWSRIGVRESPQGAFQAISEDTPVVVGGSTHRSGDADSEADVVHNDFQMRVPVVNPDTYKGVLVYTATAL